MLTNGINHVAVVTPDAARLHAFDREVFVVGDNVQEGPGLRVSMVLIENPDAKPGVLNPPGTPAAGYEVGVA